jgi:pimeloyl-ACP methyl ester carboxylesterase
MKFLFRAAFLTYVILVANHAFGAAEKSEMFQEIRVTVRGEGRALIMVPGLNSAAAVWDETCAELQTVGVQCHIMQLPGFAGLAAIAGDRAQDKFLLTMRDSVLDYIAAKKLQKPMMIGHSLGGELALQIAIKAPQQLERIIIVDSLPFFPAATAPTATAATAKPMADGMKAGMLNTPIASYNAQLKANLAGMTRNAKRLETLTEWGLASDRATTAQAMYELFTIDLRDDLAKITQPTLVLGAWAAYAQYGSSKESVRKTFTEQYAKLKGVRIEMSETGYHFLMWDDPQWVYAQIKAFIAPPKTTP